MVRSWDFMTEQELRYDLKLLRSMASVYNRFYFALTRLPELQTLETVNGMLDIYEQLRRVVKDDTPELTREEVGKRLVENIDPIGALDEIIRSVVKECLERLECYMVESGYRLPKWDRPEWLEVMEGREYKKWWLIEESGKL